MKTPYIISKLKDGRFAVHNPHPDAMEWECVDTIEDAQKKLKEKNKQYLEFINRLSGK